MKNDMRTPNYTDTLILGASAFGCGFAVTCRDCMVIEPLLLVGSEFAATYRCTPLRISRGLSNEGQKLIEEMLERDILTPDGDLSVSPVSGLLANALLEANVPVLLMSRVNNVVRRDDEWRVSYFGMNGWGHIDCRRVLDTTALGMGFKTGNVPCATKALCAMLCADALPNVKDVAGFSRGELSVSKGRFADERILKLSVSRDMSYTDARLKMLQQWETLGDSAFAGWRIAAIASMFDYSYEKPIDMTVDKGFRWIPSSSYATVIDAFEGGVTCGTLL
ncbi:hypothetical protein FACS189492_0870 [Clostridia bacterium]|nr:hypothetical protein FACS189492_0870 [Clostridia bacterium]